MTCSGSAATAPNLAYAQSKLADLMMTRHLAAIATQRGWNLLSTARAPRLHPHQPADGGRQPRARTSPGGTIVQQRCSFLPSQGVEQGTEPLLYAATSPAAVTGGYYGPGGRFGLVGPTDHRPARRAGPATPRPPPGSGPRPSASPAHTA